MAQDPLGDLSTDVRGIVVTEANGVYAYPPTLTRIADSLWRIAGF
jgi:hypothetical protein